jgi:hypothetical protein
MAASAVALHFGLDRETTVDRIVVHWPDGTTSTHRASPSDARLVIRQGDPSVEAEPFATIPSNPDAAP